MVIADSEATLLVNAQMARKGFGQFGNDFAQIFIQIHRHTGFVFTQARQMVFCTRQKARKNRKRHVITARPMMAEEINGRRDIACNPADLRGETDFFPHIIANVETRNEACFCARNAINGLHCNNYHGEWPFGSWGIGAREDAWCRIDFGREVMVDAMALILRADFPHDAYWVSGHVVLSDGAEVAFDLQKTGERQIIPLGKHTVRWMRLERMQKSNDPSAFPALTEWEVYGCDKEGE